MARRKQKPILTTEITEGPQALTEETVPEASVSVVFTHIHDPWAGA